MHTPNNKTSPDLVTQVRAAIETSELIRAVASVKPDGRVTFACGDARLRPLTPDEVRRLVDQGNLADDWSRVRVVDGFDPRPIRLCSFHGDIVLGRFTQPARVAGGVELPSGIQHSTLINCVVADEALVRNVGLLSNYVVGRGAMLLNCGSITCDAETRFGNGQELPIAIETGGREVAVFAEIDVNLAAAVARAQSQPQVLKAYAAAVADYTSQATSSRGIIASGAILRDTTQVHNTFVGPHARINGATAVSNSTLLSSADEPVAISSGAFVRDSLLQWGSDVTTMAIVDRSVLTEHSHVERHGKVTDSIIGPNTGIAEGEATACLLGPFVGFHHQALLIAVLWPEGKGNVGYGANVGSNHTSKAPDQECWPGEGAFFGLGVNIKFPADFSRSPYSIIASGVNTLPQRVAFPFSLINSPAAQYPDISPAYNEIIPAWLLTDNMFTLKRNEGKYRSRNKARRTLFDFSVFRPDTIDLMLDACRRLESVAQTKDVYTDRDVKGLGKNYMLESSRQRAIDAYRFYVRYYALLGLSSRVQQLAASGDGAKDVGQLLATKTDDAVWEHQRGLLQHELQVTDVAAALRDLPDILEKVATDVEQSKAKDDRRGAQIIEDYDLVHTPAANDKFVKQTWEETRRQVGQLKAWLDRQ